MKRAALLPVLALPLLAGGCRGKLLVTAPLKGPGSTTVRFTPGDKPLVLWAGPARLPTRPSM